MLCKRNNIPDGVAGAIVMAAGNDAPELFISALGLFVEKSALGVGTVIGSEIFNHMCISAGSCLYAKDGGFLVLMLIVRAQKDPNIQYNSQSINTSKLDNVLHLFTTIRRVAAGAAGIH